MANESDTVQIWHFLPCGEIPNCFPLQFLRFRLSRGNAGTNSCEHIEDRDGRAQMVYAQEAYRSLGSCISSRFSPSAWLS